MLSRLSSRGFASRPSLVGALLPVDRSALARDIASAGALGVSGDVVCQLFIERRSWKHSDPAQQFDVRRAVALGAFGCFYLGTFVHFLYKTYSPIVLTVASRLPAGGVRGALLHSESASHSSWPCWHSTVPEKQPTGGGLAVVLPHSSAQQNVFCLSNVALAHCDTL